MILVLPLLLMHRPLHQSSRGFWTSPSARSVRKYLKNRGFFHVITLSARNVSREWWSKLTCIYTLSCFTPHSKDVQHFYTTNVLYVILYVFLCCVWINSKLWFYWVKMRKGAKVSSTKTGAYTRKWKINSV